MSNFYHKGNPFKSSIKERYSLSKTGSKKETIHLVLDLKDSGLTYEVGDSVGIYPKHDQELVEKTLLAMRATGSELFLHKQTNEQIPLREYLCTKANITEVSPKLFKEVWIRQKNDEKKQALGVLLEENNREAFKEYVESHEIWDFLQTHHEAEFDPVELAGFFMPMLPRFYSISSSQKHVGSEVHLTIAPLEYESRGHKRRGVCTHYLCSLTELNDPSIPLFIQPSHGFKLPENLETSLIMIGPGTGIAPFRAFLQERILCHQSKGKHWLFFGEWNKAYNFFYEEDWNHFASQGNLKVDVAFSRDQEHKVYVQHKMLENGQEVFQWLENGAYIYVCGDAKHMAKDVDATLQFIIGEYGSKNPQEVKDYMKLLRQQKRYLRDVY